MPVLYALCGSLRANSLNRMALEALRILSPLPLTIDTLLPQLPLFNADLEQSPPASVLSLRDNVAHADGLIIASPEYARGIAAPLKNALEWLVGCERFANKPVMLVNTSSRATDAQAQLRLVLATMSASVNEGASLLLPLHTGTHSIENICNDPALVASARKAFSIFKQQLQQITGI